MVSYNILFKKMKKLFSDDNRPEIAMIYIPLIIVFILFNGRIQNI